jgi:hypothetical protein
MLRGRRESIAAALAIAATAAVIAGCGGGSTSSALSLDPVAAAATKTQDTGAARIRFSLGLSAPALMPKTTRIRGTGAIDGTSAEMSFRLGSLLEQMGLPSAAGSPAQLRHASIKEIALEQSGDYVIYLRLGFLSSQLPGGKQWIKLDVSKLGKAAGVDVGQLLSGSQFQPSDLLGMLKSEGAKVQKLGPATVDGVATTHYRVTVDVAKALEAKGLTTPMLKGITSKLKTLSENVWIGKDGLVRRVQLAYNVPRGEEPLRMAARMDLYDYGAHVTIAAPPSSQVFDATSFAQQGLGSLH